MQLMWAFRMVKAGQDDFFQNSIFHFTWNGVCVLLSIYEMHYLSFKQISCVTCHEAVVDSEL